MTFNTSPIVCADTRCSLCDTGLQYHGDRRCSPVALLSHSCYCHAALPQYAMDILMKYTRSRVQHIGLGHFALAQSIVPCSKLLLNLTQAYRTTRQASSALDPPRPSLHKYRHNYRTQTSRLIDGECRTVVVQLKILHVCARCTLLLLTALFHSSSPPFDHISNRTHTSSITFIAKRNHVWPNPSKSVMVWTTSQSEHRLRSLLMARSSTRRGPILAAPQGVIH